MVVFIRRSRREMSRPKRPAMGERMMGPSCFGSPAKMTEVFFEARFKGIKASGSSACPPHPQKYACNVPVEHPPQEE